MTSTRSSSRPTIGRRELESLSSANNTAVNTPTVTADIDADSPPSVTGLLNPKDLRELSNFRLKDSNFRHWKNTILTEFKYYGIDRIIQGTHKPPESPENLEDVKHWRSIEMLFDIKFINTLPTAVYEEIKDKSLRDKWLYILARFTRFDISKTTTDLFNIKLEENEKIEDFAIRLRDLEQPRIH
jgi:hypothetical protein